MPHEERQTTDQLHPTELHDQVSHDHVAPESSTRAPEDAGRSQGASMGAVETEVTPMTPPSAASDSDPDGRRTDDSYDPHVDISGGD